jgi:hypothetical protein
MARTARLRGAHAARAQWSEAQVRGVSIARSTVAFDQPPGESGEYVACGVPPDTRFQIQASAGADSSGLLDIPADASGLRRLDIVVALSQRRADTALVRVQWGVAAGESLTIGSELRRCTPAFLLDGRERGEEISSCL